MHLPSAWIVPSVPKVQRWAPLPLQSHNWIGVPLAVLEYWTSTHLPPYPVIAPVDPPPPDEKTCT